MRAAQRLLTALALATVVALAASRGAAAADGGTLGPPIHPEWQLHMEAGLEASQLGLPGLAAQHYRGALELARREKLPREELAFSSYHLGEEIRQRPHLSRGESALALFQESRSHFEACFGSDHPILIPVWVRIAALQARAGRSDEAARARARADHIAVRFFPSSHFLRERYGATRPAVMLHPLEVLHLMGAHADTPKQVVQGP